MNRILLFCALGALWGCRTVTEPTAEAIALSCATSESAKVASLTAGDAVAVFACIAGTENYFLEGAKYVVGSDGHSLTYGSTVYYPEPKQAVNFYAYVPYHTGTFSVPTDQSTAAALKQADLCWATASTTPVATPVPLTFQHLFARLIVQTNKLTSKIACQVVPSGVLNAATAQFPLTGDKREVFTTGSELIVPVQPLNRLILTVSGIDYVFEGSINLQAGQTTTLNLTLHPNTKTATLSGSSTTAWIASSQSGSIEQTVSNILTLHWVPNAHNRSVEVDKIVLSIKEGASDVISNYTVQAGIAYANQTFTVPFASSVLRYPYEIQRVDFYKSIDLIQSCNQLVGQIVYKSGPSTLGIKDISDMLRFGNLYWATGNLVAADLNSAKIGQPGDGGLLFQFGSLIGWSNGDKGDGTGNQAPKTTTIALKPKGHPATTSSWGSYRFHNPLLSSGELRTYVTTDNMDNNGIGDACRFYLGGLWRIPSLAEMQSLFGISWISYTTWNDQNLIAMWVNNGPPNNTAAGAYVGDYSGAKQKNTTRSLFFPISGLRGWSTSGFSNGIGYWGVSTIAPNYDIPIHTATYIFQCSAAYFRNDAAGGQWTGSYAAPIRCVRPI